MITFADIPFEIICIIAQLDPMVYYVIVQLCKQYIFTGNFVKFKYTHVKKSYDFNYCCGTIHIIENYLNGLKHGKKIISCCAL